MNHTERLSGLQNLFEMALALSRDNAGMQVLCVDFLPWADIAVTANSIGEPGPSSDANEMRDRWEAMCWFLERCVSTQIPDHIVMSHAYIGRIDYWPTSLREAAHRDMGPFRAVIECRNPLERAISLAR